MSALAMFLPTEAAPLLFVFGGLAFMVGARRIALGLLGIAVAIILLRPLAEPLLDMLPVWVLVVLLFYVGVAMLRAVFELFIGRRAADTAMGTLAADFFKFLIKALFLLPFLGVSALIALVRAVIR